MLFIASDSDSVDAKLVSWSSIEREFHRRDAAILLGNGASLAIWQHFGYDSLYEMACVAPGQGQLTYIDREIFDGMDTRNYEAVLSSLRTTRLINRVLGYDTKAVEERYRSIREALIHAIGKVHLPYERMTDFHREQIKAELRHYGFVFTTNYDLMYYWCTAPEKYKFKDYLWFKRFDPLDTEVRDDPTLIFYLHGGLHLYRDHEKALTLKRGSSLNAGSILQQIRDDYDNIPLFISEGTSADKMASIRGNDYLSFTYQKLISHSGPLVIFGQSLDPHFDQHIIDALRVGAKRKFWQDMSEKVTHAKRRVAISIRPSTDPVKVMQNKAKLLDELKDMDLVFFNSETHPLGDPGMKIEP